MYIELVKLTRLIFFLLIPVSIYIFYSWLLRAWIVDDAGISFAYARNLANGDGLTSWPGEKPVEGFSNFLWTIIVALLHILKIFNPLTTPKILGFVFMATSFILIQQMLLKLTGQQIWGLIANIFIATNAPIVIWCNSGLENSLYIFLVLLLIYQIIFLERPGLQRSFFLAVICFLLSITRPDGCLYFFAFPAFMLISRERSRKKTKDLMLFAIIFLLFYAGFLSFRYLYFGDWVPSPYHVKYQHLWSQTNIWDKMNYLSFAIGGRWGKFLFLSILIFIPFLKPKQQLLKKAWKTVIILWILATFNFFLLPADWMAELRFASIFIVLSYLLLILELYIFTTTYAERSDLKKIVSGCAVVLLMAYSSYHFYIRTNDFLKDPTIPFSLVKKTYPDQFNQVSQQLSLGNATLLVPDVGATLYYSDIRVYDAAGLCDRKIADKINESKEALRNYIFEELKPTLIHLHGRWEKMYDLKNDPRILRDYVPLVPKESLVQENEFYPTRFCDYIRRDAIDASNKKTYDSLFVWAIDEGFQ
jgi:hypothetical protein